MAARPPTGSERWRCESRPVGFPDARKALKQLGVGGPAGRAGVGRVGFDERDQSRKEGELLVCGRPLVRLPRPSAGVLHTRGHRKVEPDQVVVRLGQGRHEIGVAPFHHRAIGEPRLRLREVQGIGNRSARARLVEEGDGIEVEVP